MSLLIEESFDQARWCLPDVDLSQVEKIARAYDVPEIVARLLAARGIPFDDIPGFLNPTLREHFPDPFSMVGMRGFSEYMVAAIQAGKSIAIFGDFDVDGATSSALLYRFFKHLGIEVPIYIPDRLSEGYGPNLQAFKTLKEQGADVLFLLDCGSTAFETVQAGADMGLEIIILDHHEPESTLPAAVHMVNPKRHDCGADLSMLAAVGVTFMACVAMNAALREAGYYTQNKITEPPLKDWLDIVALGTVCDMVPLTGANRLFVRQGFAAMHETSNTGLKALIDVSGISGEVNVYHAGFVLGPRINAGSRVHKSDLGAKLLSTDDPAEARNIAWTLNDCNDMRKSIQADMERQAIEQAEIRGLEHKPVVIVDGEDWHTGLSGLVAGRLKEKYGKPACVIAYVKCGDGRIEGRGSGRSIPGVHIAQAFMDAKEAGLLEKGGGHAMAGGFTIIPEKLGAFKEFMEEHIARQMDKHDIAIETEIDGVLTVRGAQPQLVKVLRDHVGPFGQDHPEPLFVFENVRVWSADVVGESHVRVMISDWEGGSRMKAMAFRAVGTPLGDALLKQGKRAFHLAGTLKIDTWTGTERVEMHIKDGAFVLQGEQQKTGSGIL